MIATPVCCSTTLATSSTTETRWKGSSPCSERYERRSVIITTNLVFSNWTRIFQDPMTAMAAIDPVVHHAVILDLMGLESFHAEAARAGQQPTGPPNTARRLWRMTNQRHQGCRGGRRTGNFNCRRRQF